MISTISPGLVSENSRWGVLFVFRKLLGSIGVLQMDSAMYLPAVTKNLLNSSGILSGSSTVLSETVSFSIFELDVSEPMASLMRSQVFFGFFFALRKFESK